jgi:hypothetical protein
MSFPLFFVCQRAGIKLPIFAHAEARFVLTTVLSTWPKSIGMKLLVSANVNSKSNGLSKVFNHDSLNSQSGRLP